MRLTCTKHFAYAFFDAAALAPYKARYVAPVIPDEVDTILISVDRHSLSLVSIEPYTFACEPVFTDGWPDPAFVFLDELYDAARTATKDVGDIAAE